MAEEPGVSEAVRAFVVEIYADGRVRLGPVEALEQHGILVGWRQSKPLLVFDDAAGTLACIQIGDMMKLCEREQSRLRETRPNFALEIKRWRDGPCVRCGEPGGLPAMCAKCHEEVLATSPEHSRCPFPGCPRPEWSAG